MFDMTGVIGEKGGLVGEPEPLFAAASSFSLSLVVSAGKVKTGIVTSCCDENRKLEICQSPGGQILFSKVEFGWICIPSAVVKKEG